MTKDWRTVGAESLRGARLQRRQWQQWSENWDRDHCSGCNVKFASFAGPDVIHEGYTICSDYVHGAGYDWLCPQCFADLKDEMGWTEAPPEAGPIVRTSTADDEIFSYPGGQLVRKG
jgi:hypothetical protein